MKRYPVLIYNECCKFCKDVAYLLLRHFGEKEKLRIIPNSSKRALKVNAHLTKKDILKNVHLVKDNYIYTNMKAVVEILALKKKFRIFRYMYMVPGLNSLMDLSYFLIKKTKGWYN